MVEIKVVFLSISFLLALIFNSHRTVVLGVGESALQGGVVVRSVCDTSSLGFGLPFGMVAK